MRAFLARHREQVADDESEGAEKRRAYLDRVHAAAAGARCCSACPLWRGATAVAPDPEDPVRLHRVVARQDGAGPETWVAPESPA